MPYYCNIDTCQVPRFDREREWLAHQWRVHKVAGLFICDTCAKRHNYPDAMKRCECKQAEHCSDRNCNFIGVAKEMERHNKRKHLKMYTRMCKHCNKSFSNQYNLNRHQKVRCNKIQLGYTFGVVEEAVEDHCQQTKTKEPEQIQPFEQQDQEQHIAVDRTAHIKLEELSPSASPSGSHQKVRCNKIQLGYTFGLVEEAVEDHRQQTKTKEPEQIQSFEQQDQEQHMAVDRPAHIKLEELSPSASPSGSHQKVRCNKIQLGYTFGLVEEAVEDHRQQTKTKEPEQIQSFEQQDQEQHMAVDRPAHIKLEELSPSASPSGRSRNLFTDQESLPPPPGSPPQLLPLLLALLLPQSPATTSA